VSITERRRLPLRHWGDWPGINLTALLAILVPTAILIGLLLGPVATDPVDLARAISALATGTELDIPATVLLTIRLPRLLLAACIGALLGITGAASQGLFRNPLADPSLIGVTGGAALGAAFTLFFLGGAISTSLAITAVISLGAFTGGIAAVLLVYRLATIAGQTEVSTMLMAGIGITALAGALVSLLEYLADDSLLRQLTLWKLGAIEGAGYASVGLASLVLLACIVVLPRQASGLNALLLGESEAGYLGFDVDALKRRLVLWIAGSVGIAVALVGTIAFVGLVVPHILRLAIGPDHRRLLPASALGGALLLVCADTLARLALAPRELPVGVITALIGVPFFLSLLHQRTREAAGL
jgi:iron complex transport system permease protein